MGKWKRLARELEYVCVAGIERECKELKNKKVVLVEFPRPGAWAVGFATNETGKPISPKISDNLTSVFIPTTPNPTSGFLILVPKKDLVFLNMNFEDAMKFIISVGAVGEMK